jgi:hypothetical protein
VECYFTNTVQRKGKTIARSSWDTRHDTVTREYVNTHRTQSQDEQNTVFLLRFQYFQASLQLICLLLQPSSICEDHSQVERAASSATLYPSVCPYTPDFNSVMSHFKLYQNIKRSVLHRGVSWNVIKRNDARIQNTGECFQQVLQTFIEYTVFYYGIALNESFQFRIFNKCWIIL